MTKQQKEIILLVILLPLAAVLIFSAIKGCTEKGQPPPRKEDPPISTVQPAKDLPANPGEPASLSEKAALANPDQPAPFSEEDYLEMKEIGSSVFGEGSVWSRDPFLLPVEKPMEIPELQGIIRSDFKAAVLIDGEVYREGDSVRDFKVKKINPDSVILEKEGRMTTILME